MGIFKNLAGLRFGKLLVVRRHYENIRKTVAWDCLCDCGAEAVVPSGALVSGNTTSCGCRKRNVLGESTKKHGMSGTRTYRIFKAMRSRVSKHPRYKHLHICQRWESFENFLADMGEAPVGLTIDRIDNSKGYSPDNCRWATYKQQARNLSTNRVITYRGRSMCLSEWAEAAGKDASWLWKRLKRNSLEVAMAPFDAVFFDPEV